MLDALVRWSAAFWLRVSLFAVAIGLISPGFAATQFTASTLQANAAATRDLVSCGSAQDIKQVPVGSTGPIAAKGNSTCDRALSATSSISFDQIDASAGITAHAAIDVAAAPASSSSNLGNFATSVVVGVFAITVDDKNGAWVNFAASWHTDPDTSGAVGLPPVFSIKATSPVCNIPCDVGLPEQFDGIKGVFSKRISLAKGIWFVSLAATASVSSTVFPGPFATASGYATFNIGGAYLIDGVPVLSQASSPGDGMAGRTTALAALQISDVRKDRIVQGLAADGVAQVLIRIPATKANDQISLSIKGGQCKSADAAVCIDDYGRLYDPGNPQVNVFGNTPTSSVITLTAVDTDNGPMAVAAYRAPLDFPTSDIPTATALSAAQRQVVVTISGANAPASEFRIQIVRPPLAYVHGLTSDACSWKDFEPLIDDPAFAHYLLNYSDIIDARDARPRYPVTQLFSHVRAHVVGADWNINNLIIPRLQKALKSFRGESAALINPCHAASPERFFVAAAQADIVAHSMGGLIARKMWFVDKFADATSYGRGMIHKVITVGTPHLGSDVARRLLDGTNECVRGSTPFGTALASDATSYIYTSLTIDGVVTTGAVADLVGDGTVSRSSLLIKSLQSRPAGKSLPPLKMALIVGKATQAQFNSIDFWPGWILTHLICGTHIIADQLSPGDFLADNFTSNHWRSVFNDDSDAFVSATSARNGAPAGSPGLFVLSPVVHGRGTVSDLHFTGPHLQDASFSAIQTRTLLNTPVSRTDVFVDAPGR